MRSGSCRTWHRSAINTISSSGPSAIAVEEGVGWFELHMARAPAHQHRQGHWAPPGDAWMNCVELGPWQALPPRQVAGGKAKLAYRAGSADPVLATAKTAPGSRSAPRPAGQQPGCGSPQQAGGRAGSPRSRGHAVLSPARKLEPRRTSPVGKRRGPPPAQTAGWVRESEELVPSIWRTAGPPAAQWRKSKQGLNSGSRG